MNFMIVNFLDTGLSSGPYIMPDSKYVLNNNTLLSVLSTWSAIKCRPKIQIKTCLTPRSVIFHRKYKTRD